MDEYTAKFAPGQMVNHRLFGYRGVVYDVDTVSLYIDGERRARKRVSPPVRSYSFHTTQLHIGRAPHSFTADGSRMYGIWLEESEQGSDIMFRRVDYRGASE